MAIFHTRVDRDTNITIAIVIPAYAQIRPTTKTDTPKTHPAEIAALNGYREA